jgi:hypothetical protein
MPASRAVSCERISTGTVPLLNPVLIHRLHTGASAAAGGQMTPFNVYGFNGSVNNFSDVYRRVEAVGSPDGPLTRFRSLLVLRQLCSDLTFGLTCPI